MYKNNETPTLSDEISETFLVLLGSKSKVDFSEKRYNENFYLCLKKALKLANFESFMLYK